MMMNTARSRHRRTPILLLGMAWLVLAAGAGAQERRSPREMALQRTEAARCCTGPGSVELEVFQQSLGPNVSVERTMHLLSGDRRWVYRIRDRC